MRRQFYISSIFDWLNTRSSVQPGVGDMAQRRESPWELLEETFGNFSGSICVLEKELFLFAFGLIYDGHGRSATPCFSQFKGRGRRATSPIDPAAGDGA
jgi:hypothetical protein